MGKVYDNWERLVAAVLLREKLRQLCYAHSMSSCSSDFSSLLDVDVDDYVDVDDDSLHLQAKGKLKESEFQLTHWLSYINSSNFTRPPVYPNEIKKGLELVAKQTYSDGKMPSSDSQTAMDGDILERRAADDGPLPAIDGLMISGEAFPGQQIQAYWFSINGTTSVNIEWVRHFKDGSFHYVDGAKQPNYLVTADDVETFLAIEVQPLDDRKRKGELVKIFANEHRKITCDPAMHKCIEKTFYTGHASYKLSLLLIWGAYHDIWEPATLTVKRDGYSIKWSNSIGPIGGVVTKKFSPFTIVSITYGSSTKFSIVDSLGVERILRVESSLTDISGSRDTVVLTLRLFNLLAGEKKKKKRSLFFNK